MRRLALIGILFVGIAVAFLATGAEGDGGPTDDYQIRGYFDNAGFLVHDEEVRIAGATVGTVDSVDVTRPGEPVYANGDDDPGKAVVVMNISDPGFQDFRTDASCIIRPQSLLGEKFVECKPTEPRSAVSEPPGELEVIADGELGAGQRFLPIDNNGKAVDVDLVNNIYRQPEVDKFRLILNDLGAGLAARGKTLGDVIERADPALKQTDRVLAILAEQNKGLAQLAVDSDAVLAPLARERDHIAGFINNATIAGEAAAERSDDIEQGFVEFPNALKELELTMVQLRRFADDATPVAADLREGAPSLTGITKALGPFAEAGTTALTSLGDAAEASGPDLVASRPLIRDLGDLGEANIPGARALKKLLFTLRKTGGTDLLYKTILNFGNAVNGYDSYGHFLRGVIQINNCADITATPVTNCGSKWLTSGASAASAPDPYNNANPSPQDIIDFAEANGMTDVSDTLSDRTERAADKLRDSLGAAGDRRGEDEGSGVDSASLEGKQGQAAEDLFGYLTGDAP